MRLCRRQNESESALKWDQNWNRDFSWTERRSGEFDLVSGNAKSSVDSGNTFGCSGRTSHEHKEYLDIKSKWYLLLFFVDVLPQESDIIQKTATLEKSRQIGGLAVSSHGEKIVSSNSNAQKS